jgi:ribosomal protein L37AE/L43A
LKTKKVGSSGRMGPWYGWKLRREVKDIDAELIPSTDRSNILARWIRGAR